jgi:hypothetical protein
MSGVCDSSDTHAVLNLVPFNLEQFVLWISVELFSIILLCYFCEQIYVKVFYKVTVHSFRPTSSDNDTY